MENDVSDELQQLVTAVTKAQKYRYITTDLICRIGEQELTKRRSLKEAVKATKNKLHQIGGAYQAGKIDYQRALATIDAQDLKSSCLQVMQLHRSTQERVSILESFYTTIFAELPPIYSVLDIASGLNPLTIPWMGLPEEATYTAVDIYTDMMAFLNQFFSKINLAGLAIAQDVISNPPTHAVDLALILKTLPVLDQVDKSAVVTLLDRLKAKHLVISFPLQSLGGQRKGMRTNYAAQFERWVNGRLWEIKSFEFDTELVYLITKEDEDETTT